MDFVALDVETANASLSSICQVGLVSFRGGEVAESYSSLVNPQDDFDPINTSIHGITAEAVTVAPTFPAIWPDLRELLRGRVAVSHTMFDRSAVDQAARRYGLAECDCRWLDATRVVRRTWPQYARSGYGLSNLAEDFGIQFRHHDAMEDARATGLILVRAIKESGASIEEWLKLVAQPISPREEHSIAQEGNPDGPLFGEVVVFTGALSMPRHDAAGLAAAAGCEVDTGITKRTTVLIVGDQDIGKLAPGVEKSAKHQKAEDRIAQGQPIRILRESDFKRMLAA